MTGKLTMSSDGRIHGPASIVHNTRFPCVNGTPGGMSVPHETLGVLMHTMVSDLPSCVQVFNDPSFQASAHFGIAESGLIHQFGPVNGWRAWHAMAANSHYYGIEHADAGNPNHPLTPQQITASAQLVELLSRVGNFPLQITNTPGGEGYGTHNMGSAAYGGHTCPDLPPHHVRSAQRGEILALAREIRGGGPAPDVRSWTSEGTLTLHALCAGHLDEQVSTVLRVTVENSLGRVYRPDLAAHINDVFAGDAEPCPAGVTWQHPGGEWVTAGQLSLSALAAAELHVHPAVVLQLTAEHGGQFPVPAAAYINAVFARTPLKPAPGTVFRY